MTFVKADSVNSVQQDLSPSKRLIVALDVPTHEEALALVGQLDNVFFFKIGIELFLSGDLFGFLKRIQSERGDNGSVFVDLKFGGDISRTINAFVSRADELGIRFMTFIEAAEPSLTAKTIAAGRTARGIRQHPQFMAVPMLSDIPFDDDRIVQIGNDLLAKGFDGLVVSGSSIQPVREQVGKTVPIVSPGIRPSWNPGQDDHVRFSAPAEAIRAGATYLVVGRPIRLAVNPRDAAQRIIDEIDGAVP